MNISVNNPWYANYGYLYAYSQSWRFVQYNRGFFLTDGGTVKKAYYGVKTAYPSGMPETPRPPSVRRSTLLVATAIGLAGLVIGGVIWLGATNAASRAVADARKVALTTLEEEFILLGSEDADAIDRSFVGSARDARIDLRSHIRGLVGQGTDYPGRRTLSDVRVLSVSVPDADTVVIELTAHVRLANMRAGTIVDYSEADEYCRVVMAHDAGVWKIADVRWQYLPGSGP